MAGICCQGTISREEQGMGQIRKIGMTSQKGKKWIEKARICLIRKNRKEEEGGRNGIDDAGRAELVGGVDGFQQAGAGMHQFVVVAQQGSEGQPKEETYLKAIRLHDVLEFPDVDREPASQQKDEDVVENPVIQAVGKERLQQGILRKIGYEVVEGGIEAGEIVEADLTQQEKQ